MYFDNFWFIYIFVVYLTFRCVLSERLFDRIPSSENNSIKKRRKNIHVEGNIIFTGTYLNIYLFCKMGFKILIL